MPRRNDVLDKGRRVRLVVSIAGPSGAGKSQLAKRTVALLGEDVASRVPADYFLVPRPIETPLSDFMRQRPAWDWSLLAGLLALPIGTAATTPDFDFTAFSRRAENGGLPVAVRPVMLVDAMAPYPRPDLLVRLDASVAARRQRLAERDMRWGTTVLDRWEQLELAERTAMSQLTRPPDLFLDGERPLAENAARLAAVIRHYLAEGDHAR